MRIKLPWKLTAIFCFVVTTSILTGYLYLTAYFKAYTESNIITNIKNQLYLGKNLLETSLKDQSAAIDFQNIAFSIKQPLNLRVTVIDISGKVLADTDLAKEQLYTVENHSNRPEIKEALVKGFGISKRYSYTTKKDMLYMAIPFLSTKAKGILRFSLPLYDIKLLEAKIYKAILINALGIIILSIILIFFVVISISRPLIKMSIIAKDMARGNFSNKIHIKSSDELGQLGESLNVMSEEIKHKILTLDSEKSKLDLILSSMVEGVIVIDLDQRIILMNPSVRKIFFVDTTPEGKRIFEVIRNSQVMAIIEELTKGKIYPVTKEIIVSTPEEKILRLNAVPVMIDDQISGVILVFHDITQLRHLEKIRQDFVANVSHELRTPIASIKGYAETLLDGALEDNANAREFINIIYQDSSRLADLINDLLDLSKIELGKMKMEFEDINPRPLIEQIVNALSSQAKAKGVAIDIVYKDKLSKIKADKKKFIQVMVNLLDNAIKYNKDGGKVIISAETRDNFLQIDIKDTGIGLAQEDLDRIFERFYRVDKARSRDIGGTGLGLAIVKHIIAAHNGEVWVKSELGQGSTFSFTIGLV